MRNIKIIFIGDISGRIGRQAVAKILPKIKKQYQPDLVIANADNIAHGSGITEDTLKELMAVGIDYFTNGDHCFDRAKQLECYDKLPVIRPANYSPEAPGKGYAVLKIRGQKFLLLNLIGRVFMDKDHECPFRQAGEILAMFAKENLSAIIIDMHAEATSEKVSLAHYLDGRVSAVLGTHTHVMTADANITDQGTAYLTDVGMTGAADECIGVAKEGIIKTFLSQIKYPHVIPEKGRAMLNAVLVEINPRNARATVIKPIIKFVNIK